jgi:hypothetical protein
VLPKRPRQYAGEILALNSQEAHRDALEKVPEELRTWVREWVEDAYRKRTPPGKSSQKNPRVWS